MKEEFSKATPLFLFMFCFFFKSFCIIIKAENITHTLMFVAVENRDQIFRSVDWIKIQNVAIAR
jgi:hypothetical protein